jgi:hypothetical protein
MIPGCGALGGGGCALSGSAGDGGSDIRSLTDRPGHIRSDRPKRMRQPVVAVISSIRSSIRIESNWSSKTCHKGGPKYGVCIHLAFLGRVNRRSTIAHIDGFVLYPSPRGVRKKRSLPKFRTLYHARSACRKRPTVRSGIAMYA